MQTEGGLFFRGPLCINCIVFVIAILMHSFPCLDYLSTLDVDSVRLKLKYAFIFVITNFITPVAVVAN
jgi:hypothetical protein